MTVIIMMMKCISGCRQFAQLVELDVDVDVDVDVEDRRAQAYASMPASYTCNL